MLVVLQWNYVLGDDGILKRFSADETSKRQLILVWTDFVFTHICNPTTRIKMTILNIDT